MSLKDPILAYSAADTFEVQIIRELLTEAGIETMSTEDDSVIGSWTGGRLSTIYNPQVWIERADSERAAPIFKEYERQRAERWAANVSEGDSSVPIDVVCDECGKSAAYPRVQQGSVQSCPHCGAYVDVSLDNTPEEWRIQSAEDIS